MCVDSTDTPAPEASPATTGTAADSRAAIGATMPAAVDARRDEGVQIMRQAWSQGTATLDGRYYQVDGAIVRPLPVQEQGIPLWIAGGGEKVTLRIAAQYGQYTNFAGDPEEFTRKSEILRGHCERLGTSFEAITRSSNFNCVVGRDEAEVADRIAAIEARLTRFIGEERATKAVADLRSGAGLAGTPEQIVEKLQGLEKLGMTMDRMAHQGGRRQVGTLGSQRH